MKKYVVIALLALSLGVTHAAQPTRAPVDPATVPGIVIEGSGIASLGSGIPSSAIPIVTLPLLLITIPVGVITTVIGSFLRKNPI